VAEILVPKLNANDNTYVLLGWFAEDGARVAAGAPLVEIETSKAVEEIAAPEAGYLWRAVAEGGVVAPGQLLATVSDAPRVGVAPVAPTAAQLVTEPARALMRALGVTEEQVAALPVAVVRTADVEALAGSPVDRGHPLSKGQRAVGRAVSASHAAIPAAYTVVKIDVGAALDRAKALIRQVRQPVGLANLVIEAVAALHAEFPLFYGRLSEDGASVALDPDPHIGVTVDVGSGLYVPVIHDAARRTTAEIAGRLADFRARAADGTFRPAELDGANIGVTLHTEAEVVLAVPFIFPGQVCALAVTAPQPEVVLSADDRLSRRTVSHIGLAYDHRVINGRDAAMYLDALRAALR
jgi:2-oxoglutarate dehydrogenase E2 component (dihydrolipoamide succinyltransferase)